MPDVPPRWWVKNSTGLFHGPPDAPPPADSDTDEDSPSFSGDEDDKINSQDEQDSQDLDIRPDSPGWEDVEPDDEETPNIICLLCPLSCDTAEDMLEHCKEDHSFVFKMTVKINNLDFYSTIRYVNYIRRNVRDRVGWATFLDEESLEEVRSSEELLKPVLEDDGFLMCLDEVVGFGEDVEEGEDGGAGGR